MKVFNRKINDCKYINYLIKGIFAGFFIGIGGTAYLAVSNSFLGAFLFSIGLLTICIYGMNLFTGKIGYILVEKKGYIFELLLTLVGNFIGTYVVGFMIRNTRFVNYQEKAISLSNIKINDNYLSIFVLSIFCGMLMYLAVNNYKKLDNNIGKYLSVILCVMVFILCGFEHCVANMYYFSVANVWSLEAFAMLGIMILGNGFGSVIIALFDNKYKKWK